MNLAILCTYPPRECGIASFSKDLKDNLTLWNQNVKILAINDNNTNYNYPKEVIFRLKEENRDDYIIAAEFVNTSEIDAVFIEHEYGIFGGQDGCYVLDFVDHLEKPFILNTHTVLPLPEVMQKEVLSKLGQKSLAVICMTNRSAKLLNKVYQIPEDKIFIVPHGVPIFKEKPKEKIKASYGISDRLLVTTFGFIGPGKGIELGIKALSYLKDKYPNILYLVAGETHPSLRKKTGETYRESLVELIESIGVGEHVRFINKFLPLEDLGELLYMTDVYLTPYPYPHQAVSGTLSYAIGCGRAIVSTPYEFSLEVLANGRGLVSTKPDPAELAMLIDKILSDEQLKTYLENNAKQLGKTLVWPQAGKKYVKILESVLQTDLERKVY